MSSRWKYVAGTLGLLALAYAFVVAQEILLGVIAAIGLYGTSWLFAIFRPDEGYISALGPARAAVLTLIAFVNLVYAVAIAGQILLGVIAVCVIALLGVFVTPGGPITQARKFYERLERVDRYVRKQEGELTDGGWDDESGDDPENDTGNTDEWGTTDTDDEVGWERDRDD
jgi:hypothetical protein